MHAAVIVFPGSNADAEMIHTVGERIASLVEEGKHVAVNCLSGINRSGLLVARALVALGAQSCDATLVL